MSRRVKLSVEHGGEAKIEITLPKSEAVRELFKLESIYGKRRKR